MNNITGPTEKWFEESKPKVIIEEPVKKILTKEELNNLLGNVVRYSDQIEESLKVLYEVRKEKHISDAFISLKSLKTNVKNIV
jgi:hypothetical protein